MILSAAGPIAAIPSPAAMVFEMNPRRVVAHLRMAVSLISLGGGISLAVSCLAWMRILVFFGRHLRARKRETTVLLAGVYTCASMVCRLVSASETISAAKQDKGESFLT